MTSREAAQVMATPQSEVMVASPEHFKFTDLPGELRDKISKLAVQTDKTIFICFEKRNKKYKLVARFESKDHAQSKRGRKTFTSIKNILAPSLLLASKQMYHESIGHFLTNDLHFSCPRAFHRFVMALERKTDLEHLRRVSIDKVHFGRYEKCFEAFLHAKNLETLHLKFGGAIGDIDLDYNRPTPFSDALYRSLAGWLDGLVLPEKTKAVRKIVFKARNDIQLAANRKGSGVQTLLRCVALARYMHVLQWITATQGLTFPLHPSGFPGT